MSDYYQKLSQLLTSGTRSEKVIAHLFLSDYPFSALGSLTEIAEKTAISIPTIQRMVIKLGFKGYPEFRKSVLDELAHEKGASPLSRIQNKGYSDSLAYKQTIKNISATFAHFDPKLLHKAAKLLANKKRPVYCIGGRFTGMLATLFARHLKTIRPRVREFTPYEGALADVYINTDANTLLFITDIRRYDQPIIELCRDCKQQKKASIILVTDTWGSPAEKYADVVIRVHTSSPSGWDSNACLLVVLEEIMSLLTDNLGKEAQTQLETRDSFLRKLNHNTPTVKV